MTINSSELKPQVKDFLKRSYERGMDFDVDHLIIIILAILKKGPLTNAQVRQITAKDRFQVIKLMKELENDGVKIYRQGRNSYYYI